MWFSSLTVLWVAMWGEMCWLFVRWSADYYYYIIY